MVRRYLVILRSSAIGKLVLVAGVSALAFTLGSAFVARGAPTGSTFYACVHPFTGQMRSAYAAGQCTPAEQQISWTSFAGADLDAVYVNEDQPDSITSAMLVDGQVMNGDLAGDSVTTDKVLDGTLNADDLGANSVGSDEVIDSSLTADDLGADSVGSDEVSDNTLTSSDLGTDSVGSDEVIDNALTSDDLGTNSVTSDEIASGAVGSSEITNLSITANDLAQALQNEIDAETLEGYQIVSESATFSISGLLSLPVQCPLGKTLVAGGADVSHP